MPPCIIDSSTAEGKKAANALQLPKLKSAIPDAAFKKSLVKAFFYMFFDYAMWFGSVYGAWVLCNSPLWEAMPFWQKALASLVFWNVAGFFMWSIFIIGHDCGHTTFSDSEILNDICGHITHGSILVPYYPWQVCRYIS
jgi:omega-3 fatty acid desaturase (delta-15 desaturase)